MLYNAICFCMFFDISYSNKSDLISFDLNLNVPIANYMDEYAVWNIPRQLIPVYGFLK